MVLQSSPIIETLLSATAIPIPHRLNTERKKEMLEDSFEDLSPSLMCVLHAKKNGLNCTNSVNNNYTTFSCYNMLSNSYNSIDSNPESLESSYTMSTCLSTSSRTEYHPLASSFDASSVYTNTEEEEFCDDGTNTSEYSIVDESLYDDLSSLNSFNSKSFKISRKCQSKSDLSEVNVTVKKKSREPSYFTSYFEKVNVNSSLNKLIENDDQQKAITVTSGAKVLSNLSKSFNSLKSAASQLSKKQSALALIQSLNFDARITDDKLPVPAKNSSSSIQQPSPEIPLKTYKTQKCPILSASQSSTSMAPSIYSSSAFPSVVIKTRESRVNPNFLRSYSHDTTARQKGFLPLIVHHEHDYLNFDQYHKYYLYPQLQSDEDVMRLSYNNREKLWKSVVLDPRKDLCYSVQVKDGDDYVYLADKLSPDINDHDGSLVRNCGKCLPWIHLNSKGNMKCFRPNGILKGDVQFTAKGWCNPRWVSCV